MFLLFFTLLLQGGGDRLAPYIKETGVFQAIEPKDVAVHPNGSLYMTHFDHSQIYHYSAEGKLLKKIGGKGRGPGKFTYPVFFGLSKNRLYEFDYLNAKVSIFSAEGKFLRCLKLPSRNAILQRGSGGLMYFVQDGELKGGRSELVWVDDTSQTTKLRDIPSSDWDSGTTIHVTNGKTTISYSPIVALPNLLASRDGSRIYYSDPLAFKIEVYDGQTGKLSNTITRQDPPVAFDTEWADDKFREDTEGARNANPGVIVEKLYPEFFPAIRALYQDPDGNLVVDRWRGGPNENHSLVAYDGNGKEVPCNYSWEVLARLIGRVGDTVYLMVFEPDGELGFAKVPISEVQAYVTAHPISDWPRSRSISVSN